MDKSTWNVRLEATPAEDQLCSNSARFQKNGDSEPEASSNARRQVQRW